MKRAMGLVFVAMAVACGDAPEAADQPAAQPQPAAPSADTVAGADTLPVMPGVQRPPPVPPSGAIAVEVNEDTITVSNRYLKTGMSTIAVLNKGTESHTIEIRSILGRWLTPPIGPGGDAIIEMQVEAGTYEIKCVVGEGRRAHAARGERVTIEAVPATSE